MPLPVLKASPGRLPVAIVAARRAHALKTPYLEQETAAMPTPFPIRNFLIQAEARLPSSLPNAAQRWLKGLFLLMALILCTTPQAQECAEKAGYFENLDVADIRPALNDVAQYVQQNKHALAPDCGRRLSYTLASLYEANGNMDSARVYYKNAMGHALRCNSDTAIIETFLRSAGFFQRQLEPARAGRLLDSVSLFMKRYLGGARHNVDEKSRFAFHTYNELTSSPDFVLSLKGLNRTQLYLLRLYHQIWGNYHLLNNEPARAKQRLLIAYHYAKNNAADETEANILNNLGLLLSNEGLYQKAATFFQEALLGYEKTAERENMPNTLINLSFCFRKVKDYEKAEAYAVRAKAIAREVGLQAQFCRASIFQSKALLFDNRPAEAEQVLRESIDTATKKGLRAELTYNYRALAEALLHQAGKAQQALAFANESRAMTVAIGDSAYLPYTDLTLGNCHLNAKDYARALAYTEQSINLLLRYNDLADLDVAYKQAADVYAGMGDYKKANGYLATYEALKDSLASREVRLSLQDLEKKYESQTKQLIISRLEQAREEQEAALQNTRARNRWIAAIALGTLLVAALLFYLYRKLAAQKKKLLQNNRELEGMTHLQARLFRIIGHDLKGMTLPFDRAGRIMQHYLAKQDKQRALVYAGKLEENSLRLTETLNNLLYWSAGQLEGQAMKKEALRVKEVLAELLESFAEVAAMKQITLTDRLGIDEYVYADKGSLQIMLRNLLSNAIKFTEQGAITILSTQGPDGYALQVQDEGVGMDAAQVEAALQNPLQQSSSGTQGEQGSGIGLSIVKKLAAVHGAVMSIQSRKSGGTTVSVIFPAAGKT